MGKGDKKTKRGKLFSGSYGITRPRKKSKTNVAPPTPIKVVKSKKPVAAKVENEKVEAPKKTAESKPKPKAKAKAKKTEKVTAAVKEPKKKTKVAAKKEEESAPKKKADKKDK
ncbi:MAG: 30S ribosomal protein THX [Bacteroidales bacterium]|nr:30S ribosomal protein THX [Bacteroidales bacterium]